MSLAAEQQRPEPPPQSAPAGDAPPQVPHPRHRLVWAGVAVAAALAILGLGYRYLGNASAAPVYRFGTVTLGPVTASVIASGTVNPVTTVQVGSQVSGRIKELYADFNSQVTKGQLIARIDPDVFDTHVAQAEADLAVAKAAVVMQQAAVERSKTDLESAKADLTALEAQTVKARAALGDAEKNFKRQSELSVSGAAAMATRDTAEANYAQTRAQVGTAQAQAQSQEAAIRSAEAQVRTAEATVVSAGAQVALKAAALRATQVDLEHTYIRAPVDGTVVLRNVDVGQTVAASLQAPVLFTIARDLRAMQVDTSIDEADVGGIKVGQRALFTVDAYPGHTFEGEVVQIRIAPQVVQNVVTYDVVTSAPNPDLLLLPGLTANARVITAERKDALLVPNAALRYGQAQAAKAAAPPAGAQVFVLGTDGKPQAVAVKLGIGDNNVTEITGGALTPGQQVIVGEAPPAGAKPAASLPGFGAGPRM
jgi:HlyD family secretion protein